MGWPSNMATRLHMSLWHTHVTHTQNPAHLYSDEKFCCKRSAYVHFPHGRMEKNLHPNLQHVSIDTRRRQMVYACGHWGWTRMHVSVVYKMRWMVLLLWTLSTCYRHVIDNSVCVYFHGTQKSAVPMWYMDMVMSDNIYCAALLPCRGRANNGLHAYHRHVFT